MFLHTALQREQEFFEKVFDNVTVRRALDMRDSKMPSWVYAGSMWYLCPR